MPTERHLQMITAERPMLAQVSNFQTKLQGSLLILEVTLFGIINIAYFKRS